MGHCSGMTATRGPSIGKRGSIHTWGGDGNTWVLYDSCHSARHWTATKTRVGFCELSQDGEREGCLRLLHLPTPDQAEAIRDALESLIKRFVSQVSQIFRPRVSAGRTRC